MPKAMIISVGGTTEPLIHSLNRNRPQYIIFFVSRETRKQIPFVINRLAFKPEQIEHILASDAEKLGKCYQELSNSLPQILDHWQIKPRHLLVDYTGGTKTMSAALVLATIEFSCPYTYTGGTERTKDGRVRSGKEKARRSQNPWDELALIERRKINTLFARALYRPCCDLLEGIIKKVRDKSSRSEYQLWLKIIKAYSEWDRFRYRQALTLLEQGFYNFQPMVHRVDKLKVVFKHIEKNLTFLKKLVKDKNETLLVYDLIANAQRRAEIESRYDDAVARLYRGIEQLAQIQLKKYNINPSCLKLQQIPEKLRDEFRLKYLNEDGKIRIPLYADYRILSEVGDSLGQKFFQHEQEIKRLLDIRNNSKLAHGNRPVDQKTYESLLNVFLKFAEIDQKQLPKFPNLQL